ncbi:mannitol dehydrogenase family protein [Pseudoroseicyclus tamaricis]|uniref:Mannitol dehydrogenase family protein n=1 Tax=Pseudoroseicyclus tamaricis TaxID=2705421 RepID=A0A6B2JWL1_9RHOB|nr:mannitol dehydrogenase family protein [Pseudoroseicyclus tamaricis]NDV02510.1 mannitol dehydrogenase family protein [Pseudoroseicyclus tamaricis]
MTAPRLTRDTAGLGAAPKAGIVHLGLGAFFRAHGAIYIEEAMALSGGDWGITGVSLKSPTQRDRLAPQGGAYTAVELGPEGETARPVGIVGEVLVAPEDPGAVLAAMAGAELVTLTVTEKGYCHVPATGRLNREHPDIRRDLEQPEAPASAIGYLVRALAARRAEGRAPFTVLSCDNIPENGRLLRGLVLELAEMVEPGLAEWIAAEGAFPSSMVDRIVPATTEDDIAKVEELTGRHDAAPVMHEPFRQWVVEESFVGPRPDLGAVGVELVEDVTPFEHMKLRCLNGTHSALAYLGYLAGAETIADTVARQPLAAYVRHLWAEEILPVLTAPPGTSLEDYAEALFARYANPAIRHRTWQIAMDGSQKLPQRILGTVAETLAAGREPKGLYLAIAAWMAYTSGRDLSGAPIDVRDPLAERLAACWPGEPAEVVARYLALEDVFAEGTDRAALQAGLTEALTMLLAEGPEGAARAVVARG